MNRKKSFTFYEKLKVDSTLKRRNKAIDTCPVLRAIYFRCIAVVDFLFALVGLFHICVFTPSSSVAMLVLLHQVFFALHE